MQARIRYTAQDLSYFNFNILSEGLQIFLAIQAIDIFMRSLNSLIYQMHKLCLDQEHCFSSGLLMFCENNRWRMGTRQQL